MISQDSSAPKEQRQPRLKDPLQSSIQLLRPASRGGNHLDVILPGNTKMRLVSGSPSRTGVKVLTSSHGQFVTLEAEIKRIDLACSFHAHITAS